MDLAKLVTHIKPCKRNLKSARVKCCAACPFEDEILAHYPDLRGAFEAKRELLRRREY